MTIRLYTVEKSIGIMLHPFQCARSGGSLSFYIDSRQHSLHSSSLVHCASVYLKKGFFPICVVTGAPQIKLATSSRRKPLLGKELETTTSFYRGTRFHCLCPPGVSRAYLKIFSFVLSPLDSRFKPHHRARSLHLLLRITFSVSPFTAFFFSLQPTETVKPLPYSTLLPGPRLTNSTVCCL